MKSKYSLLFAAAIAGMSISQSSAAPYVLSTGGGDGTVTVGVDGFGAFGSSVGADQTDATFDPLGGVGPSGTSYESGVAIRFGLAGGRSFLTSGTIGSTGGLSNPTITGSATSASSSFLYGGLMFSLTQSIGDTATGVILTQTYSILNTTEAPLSFELLRYLDGDLGFDGSISDGGGRLTSPTEILFETDSATGLATEATFVGITGIGGLIPASNRYEISGYSGLRAIIESGADLSDYVGGDGGDADEFIDAGGGYDVTLALRNLFELGVGETGTYTTHTIFGVEAPEDVEDPGHNPVPEPATVISGAALAALAIGRGLRRRKA